MNRFATPTGNYDSRARQCGFNSYPRDFPPRVYQQYRPTAVMHGAACVGEIASSCLIPHYAAMGPIWPDSIGNWTPALARAEITKETHEEWTVLLQTGGDSPAFRISIGRFLPIALCAVLTIIYFMF
jgi:hypothetical protein